MQERILNWLDIPKDVLTFFGIVSRGKWYVPSHITGGPPSFINWTNGQPLGLYPSFPSFALAHGLLVRSFELKYGLSDTFRVLGDDIVIINKDIYDEYMKHLKLLHVPISESKTIISDKIAEFAGGIITKKHIMHGAKWRSPNEKRLLSLLTSLPRPMDQTSSTEFVSSIVRSTPLGTCENSEGLPLKSRIPFFYEFSEQEDSQADVQDLTLSSEMELYYKSRFCQDFNTLPLVKREEIEDFMKSIRSSLSTNEISNYNSILGRSSQDDIIRLWEYLLETFKFPFVKVPISISREILSSKHGVDYLRKSLEKVYKDNYNNPIGYFKRRFVKSSVKWENLPKHSKNQLLKIISLKFLEGRY